jgi:toxin-antitoxin system PIN domain toxin
VNSLLIFPDVNVWLALASSRHVHRAVATQWFESLGDGEPIFCRLTQMGLLRLLTTEAVMDVDVMTQRQAWSVYDSFVRDSGARFVYEPRTLDATFRDSSRLGTASPKHWTDSYLAAFALETEARLITFDKALGARVKGALVLS